MFFEMLSEDSMKLIIVDLNNFSRYPTMSVGYLTALLRGFGHNVEVISPFAVGIGSFRRVSRPSQLGYIDSVIRHATAVSSSKCVRKFRNCLVRAGSPARESVQRPTLEKLGAAFDAGADMVLVSAYTMYEDVCSAICLEAAARSVPVVIGGPMFVVPEVAQRWLKLPGLSALFAGEPEGNIEHLINAVNEGEGSVPGLMRPGDNNFSLAKPFDDLDSLPIPDYSDFPWEKYPNRIVPIMTGRGCGWGVCTFCSDVVSAAGRTFRSRSPDNVLEELALQAGRHRTNKFTFLDLKLNSDLDVWEGLIDGAQRAVPNCEWTASVHVGVKDRNGLDAATLNEARRAGLSRMTAGLESGSQSVLNAMARGTNIEKLSDYVRHGWEAGISMRMTSIIGYPGEKPDDVEQTANFLKAHRKYLDRVIVNRLAISPLTPLGDRVVSSPEKYPAIRSAKIDATTAQYSHENDTFRSPGHFRAVRKLLWQAHIINRKPLRGASLTFEGVM